MSIAFKGVGTGAATETSGAACSPTCPATVDANDILIAHVYFEDVVTTPSTPSGWTLLSGPHVVQTTIGRHWVYGKIAAGTEDGAAVAFGSQAVTTMRSARVYSFSGWVAGTIDQLVGSNGFAATSHSTDPQMPTVTTTATGSLAIALVVQNDNNSLAAATGATGGTWAEATAEFVAALTPGLVLQLQTCTPTANPGTVSGGAVAATNDPSGVIGFQIRAKVAFVGSGTPIATLSASGSSAGVQTFNGSGAVTTTLAATGSGTATNTPDAEEPPSSTGTGSPTATLSASAAGTAVQMFVGTGTPTKTLSTSAAGTAVQTFVAAGAPSTSLAATASGTATNTPDAEEPPSSTGSGTPAATLSASAAGTAVQTFVGGGTPSKTLVAIGSGTATNTPDGEVEPPPPARRAKGRRIHFVEEEEKRDPETQEVYIPPAPQEPIEAVGIYTSPLPEIPAPSAVKAPPRVLNLSEKRTPIPDSFDDDEEAFLQILMAL